jgi:hypothetical protein
MPDAYTDTGTRLLSEGPAKKIRGEKRERLRTGKRKGAEMTPKFLDNRAGREFLDSGLSDDAALN